MRWNARRKLVVAYAVKNHHITRKQACDAYMLSDHELDIWINAIDGNIERLKVKNIQLYRKAA